MNAYSIRNIIGVLSIVIAASAVVAGVVVPATADATNACSITASKTTIASGGSVTFTVSATHYQGKTVRLLNPSQGVVKSWSAIGSTFTQTHTVSNITAGGVYRVRVVEASGAALTSAPCEKSVTITVTPAQQYITPPSCPFTAQANRTIVRFGDVRLLSSVAGKSQTAPVTVALAPGTYTVRMASFDGYVGRTATNPADQPHEQWKAVVQNGNTTVAQTGYIQDVPDGVEKAMVQGVANQNLVLAQAGTAIYAKHAFYPDSDPNSVLPLCVAFDKQPVETPAPTCTMSASKTTITRGESTTLSWTSNNASSASLNNGHGAIAVNGSKTVSPTASKTFTATFTGTNNRTINCSVAVVVNEPPVLPTCPLTAADGTVVNLSNTFIRSDQTEAAAKKGPYPVSIPAGQYKVTLASFDNHGPAHATQANESWFLKLNRAGLALGSISTGAIDDLPDSQNYKVQVVNQNLNIDSAINEVTAVHAAYPNAQSPNSVYPLCAAFKPIEVVPAPTCELVANKATVIPGESVTLSWNSQNTNGGSMNQGIGTIDSNGSKSVVVTQTTTYTATFTGTNGNTVTCERTVSVDDLPPPPGDVACTLTADDTTLIRGESTELRWTSANANTAVFNQGVGSVNLNDNRGVSPIATATFVLTVTGPFGQTKDCSVTIVVEEPEVDAPTCTLTVSDTSITRGESIKVRWSSEHAVSALITPLNETRLSGEDDESPTETTTYIGTFTGANGQTVTCQDKVVIESVGTPWCEVLVNPNAITEGQSATLTWNSRNVDTVSFNNAIGAVGTQGTQTVSPLDDTTYVGTFVGQNGDTITCDTTLVVNPDTGTPGPMCTMTVDVSEPVSRGASVLLSWTSDNATLASIDNDLGSVDLDGSRTVTIGNHTTFTGTFTAADGRSVNCQASVRIKTGGGGPCLNCKGDDDDDDEPTPSIVLSKHFEAGKPRFITLTDVPYTGFSAGPVLTAFFWLTIVALSAGIAYAVTYKQPFARVTRAFSVDALVAHGEENDNRAKGASEAPIRATASIAMPTPSHVFAEAPMYRNGGPDAAIEEAAHAEHILLSPEALTIVSQEIDKANTPVHVYLAQFFAEVKQHFAPEDGWILLSRERATAIAIALKSTVKAASAPVAAPAPAPAPAFVVPVAKAEPAPVASAVAQSMPVAAMKAAAPVADVAAFVSLLTNNKQEEVFATLRDLNAKEGSTSAFIGEVVRELDEVYKHRIEGNHTVNPSIAASVAILSNADLEKVIGMLVESVDYSYSSARVGSKIAVAKVFEFFANKKA